MAAKIEVEKLNDVEFLVRANEGRSESQHRVTLTPEIYQKLSRGKITREELIRKSFEFLLDRESKESILSRFDLPLIGRYFPEYEREMKRLT